MTHNRREFLEDVANGMLMVGLGSSLVGDLGISTAWAEDQEDRLSFGPMRPLVSLLQNTDVKDLQPILVKKLQSGEANLKQLIAAASLANAEAFGGVDYVGFHTEMALIPAYEMTKELPKSRQALPVLKVLYRNTDRMHESGCHKNKALKKVAAGEFVPHQTGGETLRQAVRSQDGDKADAMFAAIAENKSTQKTFNDLLWIVADNGNNVHRFVMAHRAWQLLDIVGKEHAHTMLRQSVRYCLDREPNLQKRGHAKPLRSLVPQLLDRHKLLGKKLGTRKADDAWIEEMTKTLYLSNSEQAAEAVAVAISEGISPESITEALSLAANQLVLRQDKSGNQGWRTHGASPGVHCSDANNAWRNMIRVTDHRNTVVGLLVSAYYTGGYNAYKQEAYPHESHRAEVKARTPEKLLAETEDAIRQNNQEHASAAIAIYGEQGFSPRPVLDLMLRYAISEDGRLHGEKYYRTVTEEFAMIRPAFRWRQITALARVTASAYGYDVKDRKGFRAPGYEEACRLLNLPTT